MSEFVTKSYVDEQIGEKISRSLGIFMEHFNDKFQILQEGQQMIVERLDRLELENRKDHKEIKNRLTSLEIG